MSATISARCAVQSRPALRSTSSNSSRSRRRPSTRSLAQGHRKQGFGLGRILVEPGHPARQLRPAQPWVTLAPHRISNVPC